VRNAHALHAPTFELLLTLEAPPVRPVYAPRHGPIDETPCPACGCPLDAHRYEDGTPRDCTCCGCGWLLTHDGAAEGVA